MAVIEGVWNTVPGLKVVPLNKPLVAGRVLIGLLAAPDPAFPAGEASPKPLIWPGGAATTNGMAVMARIAVATMAWYSPPPRP